MRTHNPYYARSEYHTQLAKMSFDEIFDLTAGVFSFFTYIAQFHAKKKGKSCTVPATKPRARRTVVGRGKKSLLGDLG